jgi:hypothetical protein
MNIPSQINVLFKDTNGNSTEIKLDTKPFISGSVESVINWMVSNPIGNVDMEDITSNVTLFFLACRYNHCDNLITWLIESEETQLNFTNSEGENVLDYLAKSEFNSPEISSRIKLLMKYYSFDLEKKNKYGDSLFDILCYSGYTDVIQYILSNGYEPCKEKQIKLLKKINEIITEECDDYWSTYEINEEHFSCSLETILNILKIKE